MLPPAPPAARATSDISHKSSARVSQYAPLPDTKGSLQSTMTAKSSLLMEGKRCLKVLRSFANLKRRIAAAVLQEKPSKKSVRVSELSRCPFHLSITSLDRHNDSRSVDTTITWLEESGGSAVQEISDNRLNERLEVQRSSNQTFT